jgi:hypothetical protein
LPGAVPSTSFTYAPGGTRLTRTDAGGTALTLGGDLELRPGSTRWSKFIRPDVRREGTVSLYSHADHLGSVRLETDASGAGDLPQ